MFFLFFKWLNYIILNILYERNSSVSLVSYFLWPSRAINDCTHRSYSKDYRTACHPSHVPTLPIIVCMNMTQMLWVAVPSCHGINNVLSLKDLEKGRRGGTKHCPPVGYLICTCRLFEIIHRYTIQGHDAVLNSGQCSAYFDCRTFLFLCLSQFLSLSLAFLLSPKFKFEIKCFIDRKTFIDIFKSLYTCNNEQM